MKKQVYYISTLMILMLCYGCTTGVDELFDKTASERIDEHVTACKNLLVSTANGWLIEYYPGEERPFGGYNMIAKFDHDGNVVIRGENRLFDQEKTSHYSMLLSNSVVLSFDTYNEVLHYYSDPDIGNGKSFGGDYEFTYISGDANEMLFKGTRTGNLIRFTVLDAKVDWIEHLNKVEELRKKIVISPYVFFTLEGSSEQVELEIDNDLNKFSYIPDSSNPHVSASVPFCYTPTGINFYEPVTIGEVTARKFDWDDATGRFVSTDAKNASGTAVTLELTGKVSADYIPYQKYLGDWILSFNTDESEAVSIVEKDVYNSTFLMTGLFFDIELKYDKKTGKLAINVQHLGDFYGYYIFLCVWDNEKDRLSWLTDYGFYLTYNKDDANPEIVITDNKEWPTNKATGMLFSAFVSSIPSSLTYAGTVAEYANLSHLHK